MTSQKILFPIGAFYPSQIGGPCNTLYWHTTELTKHSLQVKVITTNLGISEGAVKVNENITDICGQVYYSTGGAHSISTILMILRAARVSDVIHLNSIFHFFSIVTFFYIKLFFPAKKIVWSVRGELNSNALKFSAYKKKILMFFYRKMYHKVIYHSTSDQETKDIKRDFPNAYVIQIPNLIKPYKRIHTPLKDQFVYVGRIHPIKALHKLIDGFAANDRFRKSNFKLLIAGKHEERYSNYYHDLLAKVKDNHLTDKIQFIGQVEGEEKEKLYAESKFLFLLSETENFGNVVIEALNQGTPVVAASGTPWSILEEYGCGYHITNTPDLISAQVDYIMEMSKDNYLKMRESAVALVDREFNIENQIHRWIHYYN